MRFVTVRELRSNSARIMRELAEGEVVITSNGKPVAILAPTSEGGVEEELRSLRRARALAALERMQGAAARSGRVAPEPVEIEREITETRRSRAR